jgi:hypothetical protein
MSHAPGHADAWLALLVRDQEWRDALELDNGALSATVIRATLPQVVAAAHSGVPVATGNKYVDRAVNGLHGDEKAALASWHGRDPLPDSLGERLVSMVICSQCGVQDLAGDACLKGPNLDVEDTHPDANLGAAWLLADGTAAGRLADPRVQATLARLKASEEA